MLLWLGFAIGVSAGLRSMTPPAVIAWAAQYRWPGLRASGLGFMAAGASAYVLSALACLELIADKLPFIPSRLAPGPLGWRVVSGGFCGAVLGAALQQPLAGGAIAGGLGGIAGAFAGYHARKRAVTKLGLPDVAVALSEDAIAIGLAALIAWRA